MIIGICDDVASELKKTKSLITRNEEFKNHKIVGMTPSDLLKAIDNDGFNLDVIILDIFYKDENYDGIKMAKKINEKYPDCCIVFVSDYVDYAEKVYEVDHVYFVRKRNMAVFLEQAIRKCILKINGSSENEYIEIYSNRVKNYVKVSDIICAEKIMRKVKIYTENSEFECILSLNKLVDMDKMNMLVKTHAAFLVNVNHISKMNVKSVVMDDGREIPVSRTYLNGVKELRQKTVEG